ncbi:hypothetical protein ACXU4B_12275 [Dyella soli]|uniref:Uncharacterized protein n=1 Tax=Dyella soli TaxID=522319 RepID=A0A4R0YL92_9GAMM|nr:hypothetical protein [Dyella soli]TCI07075.1 hypothetical protein EZM97_31165 [Dyella soli]
MTEPDAKPPEREPTPASQRVGAILWPSFFVAGVISTVFFTIVDPERLRDITFPALRLSRELGYSLGFFLFWLATASSSLFTWILLRPSRLVKRGFHCGSAP